MPSFFKPFPLRVFLGTSAYGRSFGGGGWISRFGRAEPGTSVSERRMTGTDVDGRRAAAMAFFAETTGGGVGGLFTGYCFDQCSAGQLETRKLTSRGAGIFFTCLSNISSTRFPIPVTTCSGPLNVRQLAKIVLTS